MGRYHARDKRCVAKLAMTFLCSILLRAWSLEISFLSLALIVAPVPLCNASPQENGHNDENRKNPEVNVCQSASKPDESSSSSSSQCQPSQNNSQHQQDDDANSMVGTSSIIKTKPYVYPGCQLYLAKSTLGPQSGLGIFSAVDIPRGRPIGSPDIVIQLVDYDSIPSESNLRRESTADDVQLSSSYTQSQTYKRAVGIKLLLNDYAWEGQETGGQYEGKKVSSLTPGVGSLANGHRSKKNQNVLPFRADVDEANVPRTTSPMAGSFSHYHNYTFYSSKHIVSGGEIIVNYGMNWFKEREAKERVLTEDYMQKNDKANRDNAINEDEDNVKDGGNGDNKSYFREPSWLKKNGLCLDNLYVKQSTIQDAGRGAFTKRYIPKHAVIAPAPVMQITNVDSLTTYRLKQRMPNNESRNDNQSENDGIDYEAQFHKQLLLNYCFGHPKSSLVFFPYSNVVNFINHAPSSSQKVNAKIQWSTSDQHRGKDWPYTMSFDQFLELEQTGLMLEFVATRDIMPNEEIFIDYGPAWESAYQQHVRTWNPVPGAEMYTPSYVMDDVAKMIRTEKEQLQHPYGDNLITSCFYKYSNNEDRASSYSSSMEGAKMETVTVKWEMKRGTFDYTNLRPCNILQRDATPDGKGFWYTVMIRNRYGMLQSERIPKGDIHVVTHVPRQAIRFSDKLYTTDQHLSNAFRHSIHLPDDIFPRAWMDLI